jgi:DNA-binding LytR/AlgR family response regulator
MIARLFRKHPRINIALCDDDPAATARLETLLNSRWRQLGGPFRVHHFSRGADLLAAFEKVGEEQRIPFGIIFLPVEPEGIAVAEQIRGPTLSLDDLPILVFMAPDESRCKELFRFQPCAFLQQPPSEPDVTKTLRWVVKAAAALPAGL